MAFMNFCEKERDAIAKTNPDGEVGQTLADVWENLSDEAKAKYKEPKVPKEAKEKQELVGYAAAVASESHQRVREQLSEFGAAVAPFAEEALHRLWQLQPDVHDHGKPGVTPVKPDEVLRVAKAHGYDFAVQANRCHRRRHHHHPPTSVTSALPSPCRRRRSHSSPATASASPR